MYFPELSCEFINKSPRTQRQPCTGAFLSKSCLIIQRIEDNRTCLSGFLQINDSLICGTPEIQGDLLLCFHKRSVYKYINKIQLLICHSGNVFLSSRNKIPVIKIAGVCPDILLRQLSLDPLQEWKKFLLVTLLHRIAAKKCQSVIIRMRQFLYDLILHLRCVKLSVIKVLCLRLETAGAVVTTSGNKYRHPHSDSVGTVRRHNFSNVHQLWTPDTSEPILIYNATYGKLISAQY